MHDSTPDTLNQPLPRLGAVTGTLIIVANIIGVGVFTTTGYMVAAIPSPRAVLLAWLLGGVAALCGGLTYAELGAAFPRNGGEYALLSRIYHPALGFVAGIVSAFVGFAAILALYGAFFGQYLHAVLPQVPAMPAGLGLIAVMAALHALHVESGSRFHNVFTLAKVALIVAFSAAGLIWGDPARITAAGRESVTSVMQSGALAVQLVYVSFSYSGWNAVVYLAGEFRQPQRDIPRSVAAGTTIVTILYLLLNAVFLAAAPLDDLQGSPEVAHLAATRLFGARGGNVVSLLIVAGLVSTASSNLMAGPRVWEAIGHDYPRLSFMTFRRAGGGPVVAVATQAAIACGLLLTTDVEQLLQYIGVTLSLFAAATVAGAIVLRLREPTLERPYRAWGYPLTPVIFLALEGWMIVFAIWNRPWAGAAGAATIAAGLALYLLARRRSPPV